MNKGKDIESVPPPAILKSDDVVVVELTLCKLAFENHGHVMGSGDVPRDIVPFFNYLVKEGCNCMREEHDSSLGTIQHAEFNGCVSEVWWAGGVHGRIVGGKDDEKLGSAVIGLHWLLGSWGWGGCLSRFVRCDIISHVGEIISPLLVGCEIDWGLP